MGSDDDRGQGRAVAEAAGRIVRAGRGTAGDRDQQDHQCRRGRAAGHAARIVAPEGTHPADRRAAGGVAPPDTPAAEIDAFVAQFVVRRAGRSGARMRHRWRRASCEVLGRRCAVSSWAAATACRSCCCTGSAPTSTPGCSISRRCASGRRTSRWICRATALSEQGRRRRRCRRCSPP